MANVRFDFTGQVVLVTGAASGIGFAMAKGFAAAGARVLLGDLDAVNGPKKAAELCAAGYAAEFYKIDVSSREACYALKDFVAEKYGRLDVLCSNAGVSTGKNPETGHQFIGPPVDSIPYSEYERSFKINLMGGVNLCTAFRQMFAEQKFGKVVFTCSISAYLPQPLMPQYGGMKIALAYFCQCYAKEMGEYNVNANAICPGYVYTNMFADTGMGMKDYNPTVFKDAQNAKDVVQKLGEVRSVLHRAQEPEDIANAAMFLSSDAASEITGQILMIDSGVVFR